MVPLEKMESNGHDTPHSSPRSDSIFHMLDYMRLFSAQNDASDRSLPNETVSNASEPCSTISPSTDVTSWRASSSPQIDKESIREQRQIVESEKQQRSWKLSPHSSLLDTSEESSTIEQRLWSPQNEPSAIEQPSATCSVHHCRRYTIDSCSESDRLLDSLSRPSQPQHFQQQRCLAPSTSEPSTQADAATIPMWYAKTGSEQHKASFDSLTEESCFSPSWPDESASRESVPSWQTHPPLPGECSPNEASVDLTSISDIMHNPRSVALLRQLLTFTRANSMDRTASFGSLLASHMAESSMHERDRPIPNAEAYVTATSSALSDQQTLSDSVSIVGQQSSGAATTAANGRYNHSAGSITSTPAQQVVLSPTEQESSLVNERKRPSAPLFKKRVRKKDSSEVNASSSASTGEAEESAGSKVEEAKEDEQKELPAPPKRSLNAASKQERDQKRLADRRKRRKESHNAVERRRRDLINERIAELATLLPENVLLEAIARSTGGGTAPHIDLTPYVRSSYGGGGEGDRQMLEALTQSKPNKGIILTKSVEYIKQLHETCCAMQSKIIELQNQLDFVKKKAFFGNEEQRAQDLPLFALPGTVLKGGRTQSTNLSSPSSASSATDDKDRRPGPLRSPEEEQSEPCSARDFVHPRSSRSTKANLSSAAS